MCFIYSRFLGQWVLMFILLFSFLPSYAQNQHDEGVVQVFGEVFTKDPLDQKKILGFVTVRVKSTERMTFTSTKGAFSIVSKVGDTIEFSHVGYRTARYVIPSVKSGTPFYYVSVPLDQIDYTLPEFKVRSLPTRAQFERDFVNASVENDMVSIASSNLNVDALRSLSLGVPVDGSEAINYQVLKMEFLNNYAGQATSQLFNPFAWAQFLGQLKSGSLKLNKKK